MLLTKFTTELQELITTTTTLQKLRREDVMFTIEVKDTTVFADDALRAELVAQFAKEVRYKIHMCQAKEQRVVEARVCEAHILLNDRGNPTLHCDVLFLFAA